jgi:hypothetical protein
LNPTVYLVKGVPAPFDGYLVEQDRLQKCVIAVQDSDYYKSLGEIQKQYYEEKLAAEKKIADLTLELKMKEAAAVEKGLKEELAAKSVWYRQPWFTISATVAVFVVTKVLLP